MADEYSQPSGGSSGDESATHEAVPPGGQKRKRIKYQKTSCELCKARKVKCDRAEPACSWCARHNRACVYLERQKPGSRIGFTLELESKVNRVDALLQTLWRRVEHHIANDHGHHHLHHQASSTVGHVVPTTTTTTTTTTTAAAAAPSSSSSSASSSSDLPPHDMVYSLVDLYFKHCNTWCPILDRKSTFATLLGSTSLTPPDRILLHAIVATTLRFLKDDRLSSEMRAHHHAISRQAVMLHAMEKVSITGLRALVILSLDELGTDCDGPRAWNLLALLSMNVTRLRLESETSTHVDGLPPESWIDDEGRRRLCWMVYVLDRYATVATTGVDFILDDARMRRVLPCSYDLFSRNVPVETSMPNGTVTKPENLGSFSYHCQVLRILSRIHAFLRLDPESFSPNIPATTSSTPSSDSPPTPAATTPSTWRSTYRALDASLDNWLQSLPSEYSRISALCHSDPASRVANWFMLHSAYVTAVVRLHSSAAYPTTRTAALGSPSHYAMQRCLSAVQSLRDITQDVYDANGLDLVGPPFAFALWVAARLLVVHAATVGGPVDGKVDFFIDMLACVGEYWDVANSYASVLARVVRRGRQGEASFSAMRRTAYDLSSLAASTRHSGLEQASARPTSPAERDCIDVFDFFNYPRPNGCDPAPPALLLQRPGEDVPASAAVPEPDADWLGYSSSFG
ncbi:C6 transcription factor [Ophiocordyceps camponoti-floridani]|uniref:C6 transcription factor n=1 Tax=Ophiocordyceps camponoti-floridani TaxID=2030778 RepID=A0A8H4VB68_9HYPO|nr:C6 transcription factor [Ophiocordyceps camponoti-floridani]